MASELHLWRSLFSLIFAPWYCVFVHLYLLLGNQQIFPQPLSSSPRCWKTKRKITWKKSLKNMLKVLWWTWLGPDDGYSLIRGIRIFWSSSLKFCIFHQVGQGSICEVVAWIAFFVRDWWIGWRDQILLEIVGKWNCDGLIKLLHNTTPPPPSSGGKFRVLAWTRSIQRRIEEKYWWKWCQRFVRITSLQIGNTGVKQQQKSIRNMGETEILTSKSLHIYSLDIELGRGYSE